MVNKGKRLALRWWNALSLRILTVIGPNNICWWILIVHICGSNGERIRSYR